MLRGSNVAQLRAFTRQPSIAAVSLLPAAVSVSSGCTVARFLLFGWVWVRRRASVFVPRGSCSP